MQIILITLLHLGLGWFVSIFVYEIFDIKNPLWKILFVLMWPTAVLEIIYQRMVVFINEVKEYFEEKEYDNDVD